MWRDKLGLKCYVCDGLINKIDAAPFFYKEFLKDELQRWIHGEGPECWLCYLLELYPNIEEHPPNPFPYVGCFTKQRSRHFPKYKIINDEIIKCAPRRKCSIKSNGFYKEK